MAKNRQISGKILAPIKGPLRIMGSGIVNFCFCPFAKISWPIGKNTHDLGADIQPEIRVATAIGRTISKGLWPDNGNI